MISKEISLIPTFDVHHGGGSYLYIGGATSAIPAPSATHMPSHLVARNYKDYEFPWIP